MKDRALHVQGRGFGVCPEDGSAMFVPRAGRLAGPRNSPCSDGDQLGAVKHLWAFALGAGVGHGCRSPTLVAPPRAVAADLATLTEPLGLALEPSEEGVDGLLDALQSLVELGALGADDRDEDSLPAAGLAAARWAGADLLDDLNLLESQLQLLASVFVVDCSGDDHRGLAAHSWSWEYCHCTSAVFRGYAHA